VLRHGTAIRIPVSLLELLLASQMSARIVRLACELDPKYFCLVSTFDSVFTCKGRKKLLNETVPLISNILTRSTKLTPFGLILLV
jgi:hypothetical protein